MKGPNKLLTSFEPLARSTPELIKESREKNAGKIVLKGVMQRADSVNQNGRIYPRSILEREVENYQKFIRERRALGELDHPADSVINLQKVSHLVTEMHWDGEAVVGSIELLDTPMGKIAQSLVESGVILGISSRGVGSTKDQGNYQIVDNDYILLGFDVVSEPSTSNAFMFSESKIISSDPRDALSRSDRIDRLFTDVLRCKL